MLGNALATPTSCSMSQNFCWSTNSILLLLVAIYRLYCDACREKERVLLCKAPPKVSVLRYRAAYPTVRPLVLLFSLETCSCTVSNATLALEYQSNINLEVNAESIVQTHNIRFHGCFALMI